MEALQIKTLKAKVEHVLKTHPETRDSDAELCTVTKSIFNLPESESDLRPKTDRLRRWFNQHKLYWPCDEKVAIQRGLNISEWRKALGYEKPTASKLPSVLSMPSNSKYGHKYEVVDFTYKVTCNCPGYENRGACSHVAEYLKARRIQEKAQPAMF